MRTSFRKVVPQPLRKGKEGDHVAAQILSKIWVGFGIVRCVAMERQLIRRGNRAESHPLRWCDKGARLDTRAVPSRQARRQCGARKICPDTRNDLRRHGRSGIYDQGPCPSHRSRPALAFNDRFFGQGHRTSLRADEQKFKNRKRPKVLEFKPIRTHRGRTALSCTGRKKLDSLCGLNGLRFIWRVVVLAFLVRPRPITWRIDVLFAAKLSG